MESKLQYHIVWCTKYRRKVLTEDIQIRLKELIEEICFENKFEIEHLEIVEDTVQITVKASVKDSVHKIVSQIKDFTAFKLRIEFSELRSRLPCLWTRNYYSETVGDISQDVINTYIKSQKNI